MEGIGIWIFLALFYLLQALTKRKQKQQREQQSKAPQPKPQRVPTSQQRGEPQKEKASQPQRPVSFEDLFNPDKLRDILGVPQPEPVEKPAPVPKPSPAPKPAPKPVVTKESDDESSSIWDNLGINEQAMESTETTRETGSRVASTDITDVDETSAVFQASRLSKSDITSDRFDKRKTAPGKKEPVYTLEYFDEAEDIRNAVILKEILDRPRAFRRQIR